MRQIRKIADLLVDMLFRGVVGLVIVYGVAALCRHAEFPVFVGVNFVTFFCTALLGVPGLILLFFIGVLGGS